MKLKRKQAFQALVISVLLALIASHAEARRYPTSDRVRACLQRGGEFCAGLWKK